MVTYYDVFGIDEEASEDEIKNKHRTFVKKYHPDQSDHPDSEALFNDIQQAKEALIGSGPRRTRPPKGDPTSRLNYVWEDGEPKHFQDTSTDGNNENTHKSTSGTDQSDEHSGQATGNSGTTDGTSKSGNDRTTGDENDATSQDSSGGDGSTFDATSDQGDFSEDDLHGPRTEATVETESTDSSDNSGRSIFTKRRLIGLFALGLGSQVIDVNLPFVGGDGGGGADQGPNTVNVSPEDSLQAAVDSVQAGGTVEVASGTYTEAVRVAKPLTLVAPNGAVLDGVDTTDSAGITVESQDVTIQGFDITRYNEGGIYMSEAFSDVSISAVTVKNSGDVGIGLVGDNLTVEESTVEDAGDTGIRLTSTPTGTASVSNCTVRRSNREVSYGDVESVGRGVSVIGGESVTIDSVECTDNGHRNIHVSGGDVRGQTVTISDSICAGNKSDAGIYVSGTDGNDNVTVKTTEVTDSSDAGIDVSGDIVTVADITVEDAGDSGIEVESGADGDVAVNNSVIKRSNRTVSYGDVEDAGRGVYVSGGQTVTIQNVECIDNGGESIEVGAGDVRDQSVTIQQCVSRGAGSDAGIYVSGSNGEDDLTISSTEVTGSSNYGVDADIDTVEIDDLTIEDSGDTGIHIRSSPDGMVTITNSIVSRSNREVSYGDVEEAGRGVDVSGAKTVRIDGAEAVDNGGENIIIQEGDVRGQTISIESTTVTGSKSRSGIYTGSTDGTDDHTITDTTSNGNDDYGFDLGGDNVTIRSSSATNNGEGQYNLRNTSESNATIEDSF